VQCYAVIRRGRLASRRHPQEIVAAHRPPHLARHRVLVLPGTIVEVPGWFRVSLTANDEMVESAIPRFAAAMAEATS
jgi:hypothetical protein